MGGRQRHTCGGVVGFDRQFAATTVHQHRQLHFGGATVIKQLIQHRANGAAGVEHIVEHDEVRAIDFKRELGLAPIAQAALRKVVTVHGGGDAARLAFEAQIFLQACRQPSAARGDAHQTGGGREQAAHAFEQLGVQALRVQHEVSVGTHKFSRKN